MVAYVYNPSTQEAKAGESRVKGHLFFFWSFGGSGDQTQGLICARWVLYHCYVPSLFLTFYKLYFNPCYEELFCFLRKVNYLLILKNLDIHIFSAVRSRKPCQLEPCGSSWQLCNGCPFLFIIVPTACSAHFFPTNLQWHWSLSS
jgi:hypothetical protein